MSDDKNYRGENPSPFPYTEQQIRARASTTARAPWTVHCVNGSAHKHDDRNPSAYYYPESGWYACNVCDTQGIAKDHPRRKTKTNDPTTEAKASDATVNHPRIRQMPKDAVKTVYRYYREDGDCIHEVHRFDWMSSDGVLKTFRPRHRNENGEWQFGDGPTQWQPFNANFLTDAKCIYIVEGEKCATALDAVLGQSEVAITSAHGANSPHKTDWSCVKESDATIILVPDNDEAGESYITGVAEILGRTRYDVIQMPQGVNDIADYLDAKGALDGLSREPLNLTKTSNTNIADTEQETIEWLWDGMLPKEKLTLLVGKSGINKSTLALWVAAQISRGKIKGTACGVGRTLIYSSEDNLADTIHPRLAAMGADLRQTDWLHAPRDLDRPFDFTDSEHIGKLHQLARQFDLLIIDPIIDICGDGNPNSATTVRNAIAEIVDPICRAGCAVLGIHHERKDARQDDHLPDRASGSHAWAGRPRVVWMMHKAPTADCSKEAKKRDMGTDSDSFGIVLNVKSNISKLGLAWHLEMPVVQDIITVQVGEGFSMAPSEAIAQYQKPPKVNARERLAEHRLNEDLNAVKRGTLAVQEIFEDTNTQRPIPMQELVNQVAELAGIGIQSARTAVRGTTRKQKVDRKWFCNPK